MLGVIERQPSELLKTCQVASLLGVREETIRRWARSGRLPAVRLVNGTLRYRWQDVREILRGAQRLEEMLASSQHRR